MNQFASKQFEGQTYTFEHLHSSSITLQLRVKDQPDPHQLTIDLTFGRHCFTEAFETGVHGDHHRYTHDGELRAFDTLRYECSLQLPQVMNSITSGLIYKSDQNYTYVAKITLKSKGQAVDYSVFFSLTRPANDQAKPARRLLMYVKSAYIAPLKARSKNAQNWRFKGLVVDIAGL